MSRKEVLVTGATGLVGTGLLRELSLWPYNVTVLVRNRGDVAKFRKQGLKVILGDIIEADSLAKFRSHFDLVFHLAAAIRQFEKDGQLQKTNIDGLKNVLETFGASSRKTIFVFASSIDARIRENDYSRTKIAGEAIVREFAKSHPQFHFINARIGNVCREPDSFSEDILRLVKPANWRSCLLYHELGQKYFYPVELPILAKRLIEMGENEADLGKTVEIYDAKVKVGEVCRDYIPPKMIFGRLLLTLWYSFGKLIRRGDLLIYLNSEK